jgi:hypothetical protein
VFKRLTFDYYHCTRRFIDMFYPQASPYSQFGFTPQSFNPQSFNPQSFNPQSFNPQGFNPHGSIPQGFGSQGSIPQHGYGALGHNVLPGSITPQQPFTPPQFAAPFGPSGPSGVNGTGHGIPAAAWAQPQTQFGSQPLFGQIYPQQPQQPQYPQHHLLQQIAYYHYLVAQQLAQVAAQQSGQNVLNPTVGQFPMAGQFNPGLQGASYIPGFTMH